MTTLFSPPKPASVAPPAYTPTRASASVITAGADTAAVSGYGAITNSQTGSLQQKATTGKTLTTGGV